jgi:hypothetical protein
MLTPTDTCAGVTDPALSSTAVMADKAIILRGRIPISFETKDGMQRKPKKWLGRSPEFHMGE